MVPMVSFLYENYFLIAFENGVREKEKP